MKTIIKNVMLPGGDSLVNVSVENKRISNITKDIIAADASDDVIDGKGNLLITGFYNAHGHSAMTALRGYADDLPLKRWLFEKIFPAEDKLTDKVVYNASMLAIAEMIASGTVSFSDMYFFMDETARAVIESGIKANLCRGYTSGDDTDMLTDVRFAEAKKLVSDYHMYDDGRIIAEMCVHAEYTNAEKPVRAIAEYAKENGLGIQLHASETESEHKECIERRGKTPIAWFESLGILESPVTAAHCVWVTPEDMRIMAEKGVSAAHCPISNLKLGSGVMPFSELTGAGVNIALGTDGASSNNRLDMIRELQTAAILHKGITRDPVNVPAKQIYEVATLGGAKAQRRFDSGRLEVGCRADLVLLNCDAIHNLPLYDSYSMLAYSASSSDVLMTMVDGKVLYRNGEFKTIDIEKIKAEALTLKGFFNR